MKKLFYLVALVAAAACTTNGKEDSRTDCMPVWDAPTGVYRIAARGIDYTPPYAGDVIVADPSELPPQLEMCLVDTAAGVSVSVLNLSHNIVGRLAAAGEVEKIIRQSPDAGYTIISQTVDSCRFMGLDSWCFNAVISIAAGNDSLSVHYCGYIFGNLAAVATSDADTPVSLPLYLNGFSLTDEN